MSAKGKGGKGGRGALAGSQAGIQSPLLLAIRRAMQFLKEETEKVRKVTKLVMELDTKESWWRWCWYNWIPRLNRRWFYWRSQYT